MTRRERRAYFLALLFAALMLGPSLAHLLELPNKIGLGRDDYFVVQGIYRGWALLGIVIAASLASTFAVVLVVRRRRVAFRRAVTALACTVASHGLFWLYTFPANRATSNWTEAPANWEALRRQWEYSHAAAAVLNLAALIALVLSVLARASSDEKA